MSVVSKWSLLVLYLKFIQVYSLLCYQCLDGEYSLVCNLTATFINCGSPEEVCLTAISPDTTPGRFKSHKACMNSETCRAAEARNHANCANGIIGSTCAWCCQQDRCNYDRILYKRPQVAPVTLPPTEGSTKCVPVGENNCTQLHLDHCIVKYDKYIDNFISDANLPVLCRSIPEVFSCLTTSLERCYHPGALAGVTSLIETAVTSLKTQCPGTKCSEDTVILCVYSFFTRITRIILSPGGSCELLQRELTATKQCIVLTATPCGSHVVNRYMSVYSDLTVAVSGICSVLPATIHPPITTTSLMTTTYYVTSGSSTTTYRPPTTTPWSTSASTSTTTTTTTTTSRPSSTLPPPTESPDCGVEDAVSCINDFASKISSVLALDAPDYGEICKDFDIMVECARSNTKTCSYFVQNRVEVLIEYFKHMLEGECTPTTEPPAECDTTAARTCIVTLFELKEKKDIEQACRYISNATWCVEENSRGCTADERQSLQSVLNSTVSSFIDKCQDHITCMNDTVIILHEGGISQQVTFNITRPPSEICDSLPGCKVYVDFISNEKLSPRCGNGLPVTQILLGNTDPNSRDATPQCSREITAANWQQEHSVTLSARVDLSRDGDQTRDFNIVIRKVVFGVEVERRTVCVIQVTVVDNDTDSVCKSLNDPHIHTFDNVYYNNHYQGIFRMYQHTQYPYEVQVAFQLCFERATPTCNCAVYVRAGDSVFVVDKCTRSTKCRNNCGPHLRTELFYHGAVTPGMKIFSSMNGQTFNVILPHGTRVLINAAETTLMNIYIYPSPFDWGHTIGLCGLYDGLKRNDIMDANGNFYKVDDLGQSRMSKKQSLSWRVPPESYLVSGYPADPYVASTVCLCDPPLDQPDAAPAQTCGPQYLVETCNQQLGIDITKTLPRKLSDRYQNEVIVAVNGRRKRSTEEEALPDFDFDYEPSFVTDPSTSGLWNMTSSQQYCWDFLRGDSVVQGCLSLPNIDMETEMQVCIDDILATGDTVWAPRARESVLERCRHELETNPVYIETALGRTLAANILDTMCPADCSGHGLCVRRSCQCDVTHMGVDCSMPAGGAIQGLSVENDGLCNRARSTCGSVKMYANRFVDAGGLACEFTPIKITDFDNDVATNTVSTQEGRLFTYQEMSCDLPSRRHSYSIRVTLDGVSYSENVVFVPYDSRCVQCDVISDNNITCSRQPGTCIVQAECYAAGFHMEADDCLVCDPYRSMSMLSRRHTLSCMSGGVALLVGLIIAVIIIIIVVVVCILCKKRNGSRKSRLNDEVAVSCGKFDEGAVSIAGYRDSDTV